MKNALRTDLLALAWGGGGHNINLLIVEIEFSSERRESIRLHVLSKICTCMMIW